MNNHQDPIPERPYWKRCSSCKREIPFGGIYQVCSVSTCRQKRTGLVFCSVPCWDSHLGFANHRSSYAEEARAPSREEFKETIVKQEGKPVNTERPQRRIVRPSENSPSQRSPEVPSGIETDTLVVVSKIKKLIRERSDFNTSQCAIDALTKKVIDECLKAIDHARASERKTVMGRDIL
ncbi:MAG: hypothetical protein ACE5HN_01145 [Nitrospiria bacterium]